MSVSALHNLATRWGEQSDVGQRKGRGVLPVDSFGIEVHFLPHQEYVNIVADA